MSTDTKAKGTIVLTGANGGLGSAMVSQIVNSPELAQYHGVYTVRNAEAAPALHQALQTGLPSHPHSRDILTLDLANLDSVRHVAAKINAAVATGTMPPIRALYLNAGFLEFTVQTWNANGFDMTFASNYLGHWLLTLLLLQSMDRASGRIVIVSSESHDPPNVKNKAAFSSEKWELFLRGDNTEPIARGTWSSTKEDPTHHCGYRRYGASKFCLVLMMLELQRRLDNDATLNNISVLAVDPGSIASPITRHGPWIVRVLIFRIIVPLIAPLMVYFFPDGPIRTIKTGASGMLAGGFEVGPPLQERPKALYLYGSKTLRSVTKEAKDVEKQRMLWNDTLSYAKLCQDETILQNWD